jgi:hypothetical protein
VGALRGKAPADTPALKPYWGKPAVRNFRGDDGNVGIIRSPVRAIVLPDRAVSTSTTEGFSPCEGRASDKCFLIHSLESLR